MNSGERKHVQHYYTTISGNTPQPNDIWLGEIAVNAAVGDESFFIKNKNNEIISFKKCDVKLGNTFDNIDDVDTNQNVKYVLQTLTNEQKEQTRKNINACQEPYYTQFSLQDITTAYNNSLNITIDIQGIINAIENKQLIIVPINNLAQGGYVANCYYDGILHISIIDGVGVYNIEQDINKDNILYYENINYVKWDSSLLRNIITYPTLLPIENIYITSNEIIHLDTNIQYVCNEPISGEINFILNRVDENGYDNFWSIRFFTGEIAPTINFQTFLETNILWKNGITPSFEINSYYEISFKYINNNIIACYDVFK